MRGPFCAFVGLCALLLSAGGCAGPAPQATPSPAPKVGGTLRIGVLDSFPADELIYADPGRENPSLFMRCCLARTLVTYPGEATIDGGTVLIPDLAEALPTVSVDGLAWTFRLKRGITYAPPFDQLEVTSADFVTAVERSIRINGGDIFPPFQIVEGVREFGDGSSARVSGLQTPDPYTLVIRLTKQFGALDYLADPSWAPYPASVAAGHDDDFGFYWPSTGPYMYETYPAQPLATVRAFVRNPSWSRETDPRRQASVDRIELMAAPGDLTTALADIDSGALDFLTDRLDNDATRRYRLDAASASRLRSTAGEYLYRLPMNIAAPPFDDVAVRRAVSFAVDRVAARDAVVEALNANGTARPPTVFSEHMFADSVTGGLLVGYDPLRVGDGRGDASRARNEMSHSRYDTNADGICDASACSAITFPTFDMAAGVAVARSLEIIGLKLEVVQIDETNDIVFPSNRTGIAVLPFGWGFDLSGSELAVLVRGGEIVDEGGYTANTSLVGARPEDLQQWGYPVTSVPSVDDVINRCEREVGSRRARCWAELDQLLAETIVPWAPLFTFESVWVSSPRVSQFTLDQATYQQFPALDKVSLVNN